MAAMAQPMVVDAIPVPLAAPPPGEFRLQTERVEKLATKLENAGDPETRAAALDLVQSVVELHGTALTRMLQALAKTPEGETALLEAVNDDLVSAMLLLHGLHPDDIETRVLRGIEKVRPYLKSHGGDVELSSVRDGIVRLALHGSCGSCPSSSVTLKTAVEDALFEAAPDIVEIVAENAAAAPSTHSNLVMIT
ncbi:MAG: NifU family protein [Acidobacteriaceae bacterium]